MKYKQEYELVEMKEEFMSILYGNYDLKMSSVERRWYDLCRLFPKKFVYTTDEFVEAVNKKGNKQTVIIWDEAGFYTGVNNKEKVFIEEPEKEVIISKKYEKDEILQPSYMKMLELKEMKRLRQKITRSFLFKYGFTNDEINWLEEKGYIDEK